MEAGRSGRVRPASPVGTVRHEPVGHGVTADETTDEILDLHHASAAHADATIEALELDAAGHVPWWGQDVTLHHILVHVLAETNRHCGHADLVRELIDGQIGLQSGNENLPDVDESWWRSHHGMVEAAARRAAERHG